MSVCKFSYGVHEFIITSLTHKIQRSFVMNIETLYQKTTEHGLSVEYLLNNDVIRIETKDGIFTMRLLDAKNHRVAVTSNGSWITKESIGTIVGSRLDDKYNILCAVRTGVIAIGCRIELRFDKWIKPAHLKFRVRQDLGTLLRMFFVSLQLFLKHRVRWHPRLWALHHESNIDKKYRKFHDTALHYFGTCLIDLAPVEKVYINNFLLFSNNDDDVKKIN